MRLVVMASLAGLVMLPAAVAGLDPSALVIRKSDVPAGFRVDPDETGVRTNAVEAREFPETRKVFMRWKRVTGYQTKFRRGTASIEARADVFRGTDGADKLLSLVQDQARRAGITGQKLTSFRIGSEGWIFWAGGSYALVAWRHGSVFAAVFGEGLPRATTVQLARAQQRRVAAGAR